MEEFDNAEVIEIVHASDWTELAASSDVVEVDLTGNAPDESLWEEACDDWDLGNDLY